MSERERAMESEQGRENLSEREKTGGLVSEGTSVRVGEYEFEGERRELENVICS